MRNLWTIALGELQVYLADRGNLFGLVVMPVILTLFLGGVFSGGGQGQIQVDVLDQDNSPQAEQLLANLRRINPSLRICPQDQTDENICNLDETESLDEAALVERVRDGASDALLVIPAGFGADVAAASAVNLPYYSRSSMATGDPVLQSLQAVLQQMNGTVVARRVGTGLAEALDAEVSDAYTQAVAEQANVLWANPPVTVQYVQTEANEAQNPNGGFGQSVPGMATFFVVFSVMGAAMIGLVKQRNEGTLPRMAVMPVRRAEIIGGKILAYFTIGIVQFVIVFLVGVVVGVNFGQDIVALLVLIVSYTLCITALAFALAPHMRNENQINALTTLLGMVMAALGGAWWPLSIAPPFMQAIGHLTPLAWAMDGFRQLFFFNGGLTDVLLPVGVLLAATVVLFGLGIRTFRFN